MERAIETILYWSRWLLAPIYLGLSALLVVLGFAFFKELWRLFLDAPAMSDVDAVLAALGLIDVALVAGLVVMMVLAGYETFVSRIEVADSGERLAWLGKLDASGLKLKIAASLVAISSIHLLKAFMKIDTIANDKLLWLVVIHLTFVVSTLLMAVVERLMPEKPPKRPQAD